MDYVLSGIFGLCVGCLITSGLLASRGQLGMPAQKYLLDSPMAVMRWLGGPQGAAMWADVNPEDTKDWYEEIPTGWQMRLFLKARSEGYVITPGAFGLKSDGLPYWPLPALANRIRANRECGAIS